MGQKRAARPRMPSTTGYMAAAGLTAAVLFFVLLAMLHSSGEDAAWVPAGLAASVVMMVAIAAREVVMRRAWTRYILDQDRRDRPAREAGKRSSSSSNGATVTELHSTAWRTLQHKSAEADAAVSLPEGHLEAYQLCKEYLASAEEELRSANLAAEKRAALRSSQERARVLQKHHLMKWTREASRLLTDTAQRQVLFSQKIETAMRALALIESALKVYPDEPQLKTSAIAVHEFIGSMKVAHWIELAERAAFKGHHVRAINRYRDALFYLSREAIGDAVRSETAERIGREIEFLRARLDIQDVTAELSSSPSPNRRRKKRERK